MFSHMYLIILSIAIISYFDFFFSILPISHA